MKGRYGVNRATATVSQTPVKHAANPASITFNGQQNQTATSAITTSNDGTISGGLTVSHQSNSWALISVFGNKIIVKTTAENDTWESARSGSSTLENGWGWSASDYGYKIFKDKSSGLSLEFPAVGVRNYGSMGVTGLYWSFTQYSSTHGYDIYIAKNGISVSDHLGYKSTDRNVRCVRE